MTRRIIWIDNAKVTEDKELNDLVSALGQFSVNHV